MKTAALVALGLFVCVAGRTDRKQCSGYCKEGSRFRYLPSNSYRYEYRVDTATALGGTSRDESRLHLAATADISPLSPCDFRLQLRDVVLEDSIPSDVTQHSPVPRMAEFAQALEKHSLLFSFQDGKVEELCPSAGDSAWVLNIKRGVLSAFQNSLDSFEPQESVVYERDVAGLCETRYSTSSATYPVVVRKTKDLLSCTHRLDHFLSIPSTPYNSPVNAHSLPLVKSQHSCKQNIGETGLLERAICNEVHVFRPFSNGENGAMTTVNQYLIYKKTIADGVQEDLGPVGTRTTLLYQHGKDESPLTGREHRVMQILEEMGRKTKYGVERELPELFSQLVAVLKTVGYPQLAKVFSNMRHSPLRKFLLDAMPLVGTADGMTVMIDLYKSKEITDVELDSWLTSLAFQKRPTLNMLSAISTLLDKSPRPTAILGVTSLVHSYCVMHASCRTEAVQDVMLKIERLLGDYCHPRDEEHMQLIIVALKGIGNAGFVVKSLDTLKKCYQMENPIEVRLAAIEAFRRLPCDTAPRSHLLDMYTDMRRDTEVRIAAYLAAMQCPSAQILRYVKDTLYKEDVNQVASFVWTHLTNMQETSSRWKQGIKALISNDFLKNKFNTDVRKFSRNYEASTYFDSLNAGAAVESNLIFTPQSYLPRSAMLNLTLDLFGESFNVLEVGGRAEGFENTMEDIFGPRGYFPDQSVRKFLQNFRGKNGNDLDNSIDKLSVTFDAKGNLEKEPQASIYARVFGNELLYSRFKGFQELISNVENSTYEDYMMKFVLGETTNYVKSFSLVDASYVIPTAAGLPLEFAVNGSATVGLKTSGNINLKDISKSAISLTGEFIPSAAVEMTGTMSVNAFVAKTGISSVNKLNTNTYLGGLLKIVGGKLAEVKINVPQEKMEILDVSTKLFMLHREMQHEIEGIMEDREEQQGCSPAVMSEMLGVKLCGRLTYPNASQVPDAPYFPLTGPSALQLSLLRTDTFTSYEFSYKANTDSVLSSISISFDTPGSQIDRKIQAIGIYDRKKSSASINLRTPLIKFSANGMFTRNSDVTRVDGSLSVDNADLFEVHAGVQTANNDNVGYYEPFLVLGYKEKTYLDLGGKIHYIRGVKYSADLKLKSQLKPIFITGDLNLQNDGYLLNGSINSSFVSGTVEGAIRQVSDYISSHAKVQYSVLETKEQSVEFTNKMLMSTKGDAELKSIQSSLKMSEFPNYNLDANWELRRGYNLFSHSLAWSFGNTKWETAQVYRQRILDQHIDFQLLGMLLCKQKGVDYKIDIKHQTTDISITSHAIAHLGIKHKYVASFKYLQTQDGGHELDVELSYPGFNATVNGRLVESESSHYEAYIDSKLDIKHRNPRSLKLSGMYSDLSSEVKQDHFLKMQLTGELKGELSTALSATEESVKQWLQLSAYGQTFREDVVYKYDSLHTLDVAVQLANRTYRGNAVLSNTDEEMGVTINLDFTTKLMLATRLLSHGKEDFDTVELELAWNKEKHPNNKIYLIAKSLDNKSEFIFEYPGERITGEIVSRPGSIESELQWHPKKRITAVLEWDVALDKASMLAKLETPWRGLEKQIVSAQYSADIRQTQLQAELSWQKQNMVFSASGEKNTVSNDVWDFAAKLQITSTLNSLANMTLDLNHTHGQKIQSNVLFICGKQETSLSLGWSSAPSGISADLALTSPWFDQPVSGKLNHKVDDQAYSGAIELAWAPHKEISGNFVWMRNSPLSTIIQLVTPFDGYEAFVAELLFKNSNSDLNLLSKIAFNDHLCLLSMKKSISDTHLEARGKFLTPFTQPLELGFNRIIEEKLKKDFIVIQYGDHQFFKLNRSSGFLPSRMMQVSVVANLPGHSISCNVNNVAGDNFLAQFDGVWNSKTLSMILIGNNTKPFNNVLLHYHGTISGSIIRRKFEMDFQHSQTLNVYNTSIQVPGSIFFNHVLKFENMFNWENILKVQSPLKTGFITNVQSFNERDLKFNHRMLAEVDGKKAQAQISIILSPTLDSVQVAEFTIVTPYTQPIKIEFSSEKEDEVIRSQLILEYKQKKIVITNAVKFQLLQKLIELQIETPNLKLVSLTAKYDLASPTKSVLVKLQWENKALEFNSDLTFNPLDGLGTLTVKRSDINNELLKVVMNYDFKDVHKIANFEGRFGEHEMKTGLDLVVNKQFKLKFELDTPFSEWEKMFVKANADLSKPTKTATLEIAKNSDGINLSASANLDANFYMLNIGLNSTYPSISNTSVYGIYDRRSSNNQILDVVYNYNGSKTELNAYLEHDMKNFVDAGSLEAILKTPFEGLEFLTAHVSYNNKNENNQKMKFVIIKNEWRLQIDGESTFDSLGSDAELKLQLPFKDMEKVSVSLKHRFVSNREQTVNIIVSCNKQNVEINSAIVSSGNELLANLEIKTPINDYENIKGNFNLVGIVRQQKSVSLTLLTQNHSLKLSGTLNIKSLLQVNGSLKAEFPQDELSTTAGLSYDLTGIRNAKRHVDLYLEFPNTKHEVNMLIDIPKSGKMSVELSVESPTISGRVTGNYEADPSSITASLRVLSGTTHQVVSADLLVRETLLSAQFVCPALGYEKLSLSGAFDWEADQKSALLSFVKNNQEFKVATLANVDPLFIELQVETETPIKNWEKINIHGKYDFTEENVEVLKLVAVKGESSLDIYGTLYFDSENIHGALHILQSSLGTVGLIVNHTLEKGYSVRFSAEGNNGNKLVEGHAAISQKIIQLTVQSVFTQLQKLNFTTSHNISSATRHANSELEYRGIGSENSTFRINLEIDNNRAFIKMNSLVYDEVAATLMYGNVFQDLVNPSVSLVLTVNKSKVFKAILSFALDWQNKIGIDLKMQSRIEGKKTFNLYAWCTPNFPPASLQVTAKNHVGSLMDFRSNISNVNDDGFTYKATMITESGVERSVMIEYYPNSILMRASVNTTNGGITKQHAGLVTFDKATNQLKIAAFLPAFGYESFVFNWKHGSDFIDTDLTTPFSGYEHMSISGKLKLIQRDHKSMTFFISKNENITGIDMLFQYGPNYAETAFDLMTPFSGLEKFRYVSQYDLRGPKKTAFVRLEINENVYKIAGEVFLGNLTADGALQIFTPIPELKKVKFLVSYNLLQSSSKKFVMHGDINDIRHLDFNFELQCCSNKGNFLVSSQSPLIDVSFSVVASYDFSDSSNDRILKGKIELLDVEASVSLNFGVKGSAYKHGTLKATLTRNGVPQTTQMSWELENEINQKKAEVTLDLDGRKTEVRAGLKIDSLNSLDISLSSILPSYGMNSLKAYWNVMKRNKMQGKLEILWNSVKVIDLQTSLELSAGGYPIKFTITFGSPFKNFENFSFMSTMAHSNGFTSESTMQWNEGKKIVLIGSFNFKSFKADTKVSLITSFMEPLVLTMDYNFNSPKQIFDAKFVYGSKKLQLDINYIPIAPELTIIMTTPFRGFTYLQLNGRYEPKKSLQLTYLQEDYTTQFVAAIHTQGHKTDLGVTLITPSEVLKKLVFNSTYIKFTEVSSSLQLKWGKGKYMIGSGRFLPHSMRLQMNTTFESWEFINVESAFVRSKYINRAHLGIKCGANKLDLSASLTPYSNDSTYVELNLMTPWTVNYTLKGVHQQTDGHSIHLSFHQGENSSEIQAKLNYEIEDNLLVFNLEALLDDIGKLTISTGYNTTSSMSTAYFKQELGTLRLLARIESVRNDQGRVGKFHLETPFKNMKKIDAKIEINLAEKSGLLSFNRNGVLYKMLCVVNFSEKYYGGWLALHSPKFHMNNATLDIHFNKKSVNISINALEKRIDIITSYILEEFMFSLDTLLEVPFIKSLEHVSLFMNVNADNLTGSVKGHWSRDDGITIVVNLNPEDLHLSIQTPFEMLHSIQMSGKLLSTLTSHELTGHIDWEEFKLDINSALKTQPNDYSIQTLLKWNGKDNITLQSNLKISDQYDSEIQSQLHLKMPFEQFDHLDIKFVSKMVPEGKYVYNFILSTPHSVIPSFQSSLVFHSDENNNLNVNFITQSMNKEITITAALNTDDPENMYGKLDIRIPFGNIPPIIVEGQMNLTQWRECAASLQLRLPGSVYLLTGSYALYEDHLNTKLELQAPKINCQVSFGSNFNNKIYRGKADITMNSNKVSASYKIEKSSFSVRLNLNMPILKIQNTDLNIAADYSEIGIHGSIVYKYLKHENTIQVRFERMPSREIHTIIDLHLPYLLGKNPQSACFNMKLGLPQFSVEADYNNGKFTRSASLKIENGSDYLNVVGHVTGPDMAERRGSLSLRKNGELVQLKLADWLNAELSTKSDSGFIILAFPKQQHKLQYYVQSDDSFEGNVQIESPLFRNGKANVVVAYKNTGTHIQGKFNYVSGATQHSVSVELKAAKQNMIKVQVIADNRTIVGLESSLLFDKQNINGKAVLELFQQQSTISVKHRTTFPLDSELKIVSPLLLKDPVEVSLSTEGSLLAYAGYGDTKNGRYILLEATFSQEDGKLDINLQAPILSSMKSFGFNGECVMENDSLKFSVASTFSSAKLSSVEASLNLHLSKTVFEGDFKINTPIRKFEHYGGNVHIPLRFDKNTQLNFSLSLPQGKYLYCTTFKQLEEYVEFALITQYKETLANATFKLEYSPKFLLFAEINTPFSSFSHYRLNLKGQKNLKDGNDVVNYLEWNEKKIELRYSFLMEMKKFLTQVELRTPFHDYDYYAMKVQYENNVRKVAIATLTYPGLKKAVGIEFDYLYKGIFDINLIAQFNIPFLPGFETASFLLGNKLNLGEGSYKAVMSGHINDIISSLAVEGVLNSEAAKLEIQAHQNDKEIYLQALSALNSRHKLILLWELRTPFPVIKNMKTFLHHGPHEIQIGAIYNSKEIMGLDMKYFDNHLTFELRNPIRPVSLSYVYEFGKDILFSAEVCWNLNNKLYSQIGVTFSSKSSVKDRLEIKSELKLPTRIISYDTIAEQSESKIEYAMHFSWEEGKPIGYHILVNQVFPKLISFARVDFPLRSFEGSHEFMIIPYYYQKTEFLWDAANNRDKKIGHEIQLDNNGLQLTIHNALLPHDIIIQYAQQYRDRLSRVPYSRQIKIVYSPLPEDVFTLGTYFEYVDSDNWPTMSISVHHKASNLGLDAKLDVSESTEVIRGKLNITYVESDTGKSQELIASGKIGYQLPEIEILFETSTNRLVVGGAIWSQKNGYDGISFTCQMNQKEPLILSAAINTAETAIEVELSYGNSRRYTLRGQFPNWREITAEASHSLNGVRTHDGFVTLRLNTTQLLWTRVQWSPRILEDMKPAIIQEYADLAYVIKAIAQSYMQLFNEEFKVRFPVITFRDIADYTKSELDAVLQDFRAMGVDVSSMYKRNDFFLRDICHIIKSSCSDLHALLTSVGTMVVETFNVLYSSFKNYFSFLWNTLSMDYIASSLSNFIREIQKLSQTAMQNILNLMDHLYQLKDSFKQSAKKVLEYTRWYLFLLRENLAQISEDIGLIVQSLTRVFKESLEKAIEKLEYHASYVQVEVMVVVLRIAEFIDDISATLKTIPEVQHLLDAYVSYATWLEEFHVQGYIDDLMDTVADAVDWLVNDLVKALNDFKMLLIGTTKPYLNEVDQIPMLLCIRTTINEIYQKVAWLWKYYQITNRVLSGLDTAIEQADDILLDVMAGLDTDMTQDSKTDMVFKPNLGLVEYSQELPVEWNGFNELPKFEKFSWYPKEKRSEEQMSKLDRYSYFFLDPLNTMVNKSMSSLMTPFSKRAIVAGKNHFITFDNKFFEFEGECSYLLASDFLDNKFSAVINYDIQNHKVVKKSLTVISEGQHIDISSNNRISIDGKKTELPVKVGQSTWVTRSGERLLVHTKFGMAIECNLYHDICSVELTGWYFGKTGGLLGTFDNEPSNDISLPDGTITPNIEFFAKSWRVGRNSRCRPRTQIPDVEESTQHSETESHVCSKYFQHSSSPLSLCYSQIDPKLYYKMCLQDSADEKAGMCLSAATYVTQCKKIGVDIWMPTECVSCQLTDGTVMKAGEEKVYTGDSPQSADVVLVVEQASCLKTVKIIDAVSKLDAALNEKGISNARYSVVGFGGDKFYRPHTRTADGEVWATRKSVEKALNGLEFDSENTSDDVNVYDALWYAARLSFRGGVSKTVVLVQCQACDQLEQRNDYSDMLQALQENDITLHILQMEAVKLGGSPQKTAKLFGMDTQGTFSGRNAKNLIPSRSLLSQVALPKNLCTPLALETNGTLFNLNHVMGNKAPSAGKRFLDVWSHRVAQTAMPSGCQKCECVADRDSVGQIMCTKCHSPSIDSILQDLAIMWSLEDLGPETYDS